MIKGTTVAIDGPHNFDSVHLINGGVLTHTANTTTATHKLDLTVTEQVIVDATSRIDVSGKGYLAGRTTGNTTVGGATGESWGQLRWLGARQGGSERGVRGLCRSERLGQRWWTDGNQFGRRFGANYSAPFQLDGLMLANGDRRTEGHTEVGQAAGSTLAATLAGTGYRQSAAVDRPEWGRIAVYAGDFREFDLAKITAPGGAARCRYGVLA